MRNSNLDINICPLCQYEMGPFDTECLRCHGKGIEKPPAPNPVITPPPTPKRISTPNTISYSPVEKKSVLPVISAFFAVLLIAAFLGYRYWVSTPQYSLLQARNAYIAHDLGTFEKYVAIDMCVESMVDDVLTASINESKAKLSQQENGIGKLGQAFAEGFMNMLKPALAKAIKEATRSYVSNEPIQTDGKNDYIKNSQSKIEEQGLEFQGIQNVELESNMATVTLGFYSKQNEKDYPLKLQMRRVENYWQVVKWLEPTTFLKEAGADLNGARNSNTPIPPAPSSEAASPTPLVSPTPPAESLTSETPAPDSSITPLH